MVTIKQVAKRAGVSPTTVSYVLNGRPEVKQETVEKVLKAARELNYVPNHLAKSFRSGKSNTVGLITTEHLDDYSIFSLELMGVLLEARRLKYDVLVKSLNEESLEYTDEVLQIVKNRKVDGLLLLGNGLESVIEQLVKNNSKFVLLSSHSKFDINVVNVDGEKWVYNITEYLIKKGYSDIFYATFALETVEELNRERGFKRALNDYGISSKGRVITCGYDSKGVYQSVQDLLANTSVRAFVCWNDLLALQIINVLKEAGKRIPDDIAVAGFDDIVQDMFFTPQLTTVRQPFVEKGRCAMNLLVDVIEGRIKEPVKRFVECSIVERESV